MVFSALSVGLLLPVLFTAVVLLIFDCKLESEILFVTAFPWSSRDGSRLLVDVILGVVLSGVSSFLSNEGNVSIGIEPGVISSVERML